MPKRSSLPFDPAEYATVAERIALFWTAFPLGRIETELYQRDDRQITFRAQVWRHGDDPRPSATGWASEREGDGEVNRFACLENAETSAVGRALANLGFTASRRRPSREEMASAAARAHRPGELRLVREAPPQPTAPPASPTRDDARTDWLVEPHENARLDVLLLLDTAEREGFPAREAAGVRQQLERRLFAPGELARFEARVREWLRARDRERLHEARTAPGRDGDAGGAGDGEDAGGAPD